MTIESKGKAKRGNPAWLKGPDGAGSSGNPGGRKPKTDAERAGELYLRERTLSAAKTLVELQGVEHEPKIRLGATVAHLKITLGELERQAGPNGEVVTPHSALTREELMALARAQLEKEREKLPPTNAAK